MSCDIIIVTYNRVEYLRQLLFSIERQTVSPVKVVVYDDMSTDSTVEFLNSYEPDGFVLSVLVGQKKSVSTAASRNLCLEYCVSDFVIVMDDDDLMPKQKIEKIQNILSGDYVAVLGSTVTFDDKLASRVRHRAICKSRALTLSDFWGGNVFHWASFAVRRENLLEVGGFDERLKMCPDWALYISLISRYSFFYVDEVLGYYRLHDSNMSKGLKTLSADLELLAAEKSFQVLGIDDYKFRVDFSCSWQEKRYWSCLKLCLFAKGVSTKRRVRHLAGLLTMSYGIYVNYRAREPVLSSPDEFLLEVVSRS